MGELVSRSWNHAAAAAATATPPRPARRERFAPLATVDGGLQLQSMHTAADGTRKLVFKLAHGPAAGGQVCEPGVQAGLQHMAAAGAIVACCCFMFPCF